MQPKWQKLLKSFRFAAGLQPYRGIFKSSLADLTFTANLEITTNQGSNFNSRIIIWRIDSTT